MNTSKILFLTITSSVFLLTGCGSQNPENSSSDESSSATVSSEPRTDLITQTIINDEGEEITLGTGELRTVKEKNATIRTAQSFDTVEGSTLTLEENKVVVMRFIKNSTIIIKNGAILEVPYIKDSKIIVEKGGDLRVSDRLKDTKVLLEQGEFSVRPADIDESSTITE